MASKVDNIDFNQESVHIDGYDYSLFYITFEGNLCMKDTLTICSYKISFMASGRSTGDGHASVAVMATKINIISPLELVQLEDLSGHISDYSTDSD